MVFWSGKTVLITGHTGFKGSWLSFWLVRLGANVVGVALSPETQPALFDQLGLSQQVEHHLCDLREVDRLQSLVQHIQPDIIFHLAAQPLVRRSYREPLLTWETNVMGTIYLLEGLRKIQMPCAVVLVTTDKVYENCEWNFGYRETDALGGHDPYSSSKAAMEIAIRAWRKSFFATDHPVALASARAGNVIGGGDWAVDRIVPDAIRALQMGNPIPVRNPLSTRPWQHVLDPLSGYMLLAEKLYKHIGIGEDNPFTQAFNFGPMLPSNKTVQVLVEKILLYWPGTWQNCVKVQAPHEAGKLNLATDKAFHELRWQPCWGFEEAVEKTVTWYQAVSKGANAAKISMDQIRSYEQSVQLLIPSSNGT